MENVKTKNMTFQHANAGKLRKFKPTQNSTLAAQGHIYLFLFREEREYVTDGQLFLI